MTPRHASGSRGLAAARTDSQLGSSGATSGFITPTSGITPAVPSSAGDSSSGSASSSLVDGSHPAAATTAGVQPATATPAGNATPPRRTTTPQRDGSSPQRRVSQGGGQPGPAVGRVTPPRRTRQDTARDLVADVGLTRLASYLSVVKGTPMVRRSTLRSSAAIVAACKSIETANPELRLSVHLSGVNPAGTISWVNLFGSGRLLDPEVLRVQSQVHQYARGQDGLVRAGAALRCAPAHLVGTYPAGENPVRPVAEAGTPERPVRMMTQEEWVELMTPPGDNVLEQLPDIVRLRRELEEASVGMGQSVTPDVRLEGSDLPADVFPRAPPIATQAAPVLLPAAAGGPLGILPTVIESSQAHPPHQPSSRSVAFMDTLLSANRSRARTLRATLKSAVMFITSRAGTIPRNFQDCTGSWWPYVLVQPGSGAPASEREQWQYGVNVPTRMVTTTRRSRSSSAEGFTLVVLDKIPTNDSQSSQNEVVASLLLLWDKDVGVQRTLLDALYAARSASPAKARTPGGTVPAQTAQPRGSATALAPASATSGASPPSHPSDRPGAAQPRALSPAVLPASATTGTSTVAVPNGGPSAAPLPSSAPGVVPASAASGASPAEQVGGALSADASAPAAQTADADRTPSGATQVGSVPGNLPLGGATAAAAPVGSVLPIPAARFEGTGAAPAPSLGLPAAAVPAAGRNPLWGLDPLPVSLLDAVGDIVARGSVDTARRVLHGRAVPMELVVVLVSEVRKPHALYPHAERFPVELYGDADGTTMSKTISTYIVWERLHLHSE